MIENAEALDTNYVPQDLQNRTGKIQKLANALQPITDDLPGEHSMIFGPSGSGKTTLAKYAVRKLRQEAFDIRTAYWNCLHGGSKTEVLKNLCEDASLGRKLPEDGVSSGRYIQEFKETDDQIVAIVDEVDDIDDPGALVGLGDVPGVTLVLVTIDEDLLFSDHKFEGRFKTRFFSGKMVRLKSYSTAELEEILWYRIEHGLNPGVIDPEVVSYIANTSENNARRAIKYLRRGAKRARDETGSPITIADIDAITDEVAEDRRDELVKALGTHKRRLFDIIDEAGEIRASNLTAEYKRRSRDPRKSSSRGRYLKSLEEKYELIESEGTTKGTVYRITDPR